MELKDLPVYKLWLVKTNIEVTRMPQDESIRTMQKHDEFFQKVGGKLLLAADMSWSNEEFINFGIEEFPNLEALIEFNDCLRSLNWFDYMTAKTYVGYSLNWNGQPVPFVPPPPPEPGTKPIYKVFLFRNTPLYYQDRQGAVEMAEKIEEAAKKAGMLNVMMAYTRLSNEKWLGFGLERYPSINAFFEKYLLMETLGWYRYAEAESYIGHAVEGLLAADQK